MWLFGTEICISLKEINMDNGEGYEKLCKLVKGKEWKKINIFRIPMRRKLVLLSKIKKLFAHSS